MQVGEDNESDTFGLDRGVLTFINERCCQFPAFVIPADTEGVQRFLQLRSISPTSEGIAWRDAAACLVPADFLGPDRRAGPLRAPGGVTAGLSGALGPSVTCTQMGMSPTASRPRMRSGKTTREYTCRDLLLCNTLYSPTTVCLPAKSDTQQEFGTQRECRQADASTRGGADVKRDFGDSAGAGGAFVIGKGWREGEGIGVLG